MVVSFKYLLTIWLIMIVVQVLWLRYQPIDKTKLGTTCAWVACAIWHLFLVVVVGFPIHYLISRNYFIVIVITGVHCSEGGLPVESAPSAIICFHQKQKNSERPTTKKLFWVDKLYKLCTMQWSQAQCTLRWTLDTEQAVQCKKILPRSRVPWIS